MFENYLTPEEFIRAFCAELERRGHHPVIEEIEDEGPPPWMN